MNRTDELTDQLLDGSISDAEAVELHALLAADPAAVRRHLALVRLELVLRGLRTEFDFADDTVARIESDRVNRTTAAVLSKITPRPTVRPRRWLRWVALAGLAAVVFVGVWLALPRRTPSTDHPPANDFARITSVTGCVEVVGPAGTFPAQSNQQLRPDDTLRVVGEESAAVLEFADRTRIEVHPESAVRVDADLRKVLLLEGRVTATATGRRLVVGSGATEVEASRGGFALCSAGPGSARVEPFDGDVRVVRGAPAEQAEPVVLGPGHIAFVRDEQTPMRVEATERVDTVPRDKLNFMAIDARFVGAEVWAVTAKQWARWTPSTPDLGSTLFLPKVFNDGPCAVLTPDGSALAACRVDDKEEQLLIRAMPSGAERAVFPVRASDPRFLCVAPDTSWAATTGGVKPNHRTVRVWDVATGNERFAREMPFTPMVLAASPDGRWLTVGAMDISKGMEGAVVAFDAATGDKAFELPTRRKGAISFAYTADSKRLAVGFNGAVQIWDVPGRKLLRTLEGFERVVSRLAFDDSGTVLAAGTGDGQVWVWSADTGRRRQVIEAGTRGVRAVAFSPDGKSLVTATNKAGIAVWDVAPEGP